MSDLLIYFLVLALIVLVVWVWRMIKANAEHREEGEPNIWTLQYWIWRKTKKDEQAQRDKEAE